jgi:hypothetical protein
VAGRSAPRALQSADDPKHSASQKDLTAWTCEPSPRLRDLRSAPIGGMVGFAIALMAARSDSREPRVVWTRLTTRYGGAVAPSGGFG